MTAKDKFFGALFTLLIVTAVALYFFPRKLNVSDTNTSPAPPPPPARPFADEIEVFVPTIDAIIVSPQELSGRARGSWFFEANMPVTLIDENKKILAKAPLQAQGEWMTADFVPFAGSIIFEKPATKSGILIFENDNPSGFPEHAKSFTVPVRFE